MAKAQQKSEVLVLVGGTNGLVVVPQPTLLTRLHYFDGKLLRADDLKREQDYLRSLVHLSNQAGGFGVVHGFDLALSSAGSALLVGPGMAIDPNGRVLLLPVSGTQLGVDELIQKSQATSAQSTGKGSGSPAASAASFVDCLPSEAATPSPDHTPRDASLYLITVGFAEALCGQDDVFGKLCEEACAGSTDRPFTVEGLVFRAIPLVLQTPLATSAEVTLGPEHRRSLVASAYFADERAALPHLISGAGLRSQAWCKGALLFCGNDVALGVLSRSGAQTQFLDTWIARRERIEDAPRRYWAMRMAMRPWNVFLAQILQFQCQLADLLKGQNGPGTPDDPCASALNEAAELLESVKGAIGTRGGDAAASAIQKLEEFLSQAKTDVTSLPGERMLIEGGIVELPSAGYLPVSPTALVTVNDQVRRLVGEGLDLRFCVVRPDFVHHALEEAQHMDRISLLQGLDDPDDKPEVDILVPDGEIQSVLSRNDRLLFRTTIGINDDLFRGGGDSGNSGAEDGDGTTSGQDTVEIQGASRVEPLIGRGAAFHAAGIARISESGKGRSPARSYWSSSMASKIAGSYKKSGVNKASSGGADGDAGGLASQKYASGVNASGWLTARAESNPFTSKYGDVVPLSASAVLAIALGAAAGVAQINAGGNLRVLAVSHPSSTEWKLSAKVDVWVSFESSGSNGQSSKDSTQGSILVNATFTGAADAAELTATLSSPDPSDEFAATLTVKWGGAPLKVAVSLVGGEDNPMEVVTVKLAHDAELLDPANAWHGIALQAVSAIGVALKDSLFADNAENLLFPSPQQDEAGLVVRAVRDWVLFHRRRNKRCSIDTVKPALPPKRYQLFTVAMEDLGRVPPTANAIYQAFVNGNQEQIERLRRSSKPVTIIEYAGGKATLLTQEPTLKSAWQSQVPTGRRIALGLIATKDADDVTILEVARVERVEQVVSSLTSLAAGAQSLSLTDVPPDFDSPATDGFILCGTVPDVVTECQSAFVMELPEQSWNDTSFDPILKEFSSIFAGIGDGGGKVSSAYLGSVDFATNDASIVGGNEIASRYSAWVSGVGHDVVPVFCDAFAPSDGGVDVNTSPHRQRSLAIGRELSPDVVTSVTTVTAAGTPPDMTCPVAAIVAAVPVFVNVVVIDLNPREIPREALMSRLSDNKFPAEGEVASLDPGNVRFLGATPLPGDIGQLASALGFPPPVDGGIIAFSAMALTGPAGSDDKARLANLEAALAKAGMLESNATGAPRAFLVDDPKFLGFKEPAARHALFLFRLVYSDMIRPRVPS